MSIVESMSPMHFTKAISNLFRNLNVLSSIFLHMSYYYSSSVNVEHFVYEINAILKSLKNE